MVPVLNWVISNWIENLAVVTGIAYIVLSIKQRISCWFFGIISSGLYLVVFYQTKIYADMLLQAYYVGMGFYGWIQWLPKTNKQKSDTLKVAKLQMKSALLMAAITLILFFLLAWFLLKFTDSPVPWVDAFTTSLSLTATYMLARKILEHWLVWIIVDTVSIGLFLNRELYSSIVLFLILTFLAIIGYVQWKKEWKSQISL